VLRVDPQALEVRHARRHEIPDDPIPILYDEHLGVLRMNMVK
jgi:hypothetical protein